MEPPIWGAAGIWTATPVPLMGIGQLQSVTRPLIRTVSGAVCDMLSKPSKN